MMMQRRSRLAPAIGIALCALILASAVLYGVTGTVYIDRNKDLEYDSADLPLSGVVVSDGCTVVSTNDRGVFTLEPDSEARFVFICLPSGTRPLDGWYRSLAAGDTFTFPLEEVTDDSPLVFVQLSDAHYATDPGEFKKAFYDRRMKVLPETVFDEIVPEVNDLGPDFVILTGDIVADSKRPDISLVDKWMDYMGTDFAPRFSAPFYAVVGNHDVVRDETVDKAIYERYFGPTYYSFNVKGVHFVVLDTQQLVGTKLVYTVTPAQLSWLEQDLAAADTGAPVVVFCHEPSPDWAETPENEALLDLLQQTGITALLSGHWHTNFILQRYPFYELTSGAVCASWWEGEGPDGTEFGYRVYRIVRGNLDSIWRDAGLNSVEFHSPQRAVIQWTERLQAAVWGDAARASLSIDGAETIGTPVFYNSLWTTTYGNLNLSTLEDGDHSLAVTFYMADGSTIESVYPFYVCNPDLTIKEIVERIDTFQGKIIAAPRLVVKAIIGSDISASDGTKTIIISKFPYPVEKNDVIGIVGIYRSTSTAPIKAYDSIFFTKYDEAAE